MPSRLTATPLNINTLRRSGAIGRDQRAVQVGRRLVPVVAKPIPHGGHKQWFRCTCGRNVTLLFPPAYTCRHCSAIWYWNSDRAAYHLKRIA